MKTQFDNIKTEIWPLSIRALEMMGQRDALLNVRRMSGPGYVCMYEGEAIAAAGLGRLCGRQFFAWVVMTEKVKSNKLLMCKLTRLVKTIFAATCQAIQPETVEAETSEDPGFCAWLERFGFKRIPVARYRWRSDD